MKPTSRLYFTDSALLEFDASVVELKDSGSGTLVLLDQTAFYPTGGGQPHDVGSLDQSGVLDVFEDETGSIYHLVSQSSFKPGDTVRGKVDHIRRRDHLQQHSGQHILSQAFVQACGAETRSFHLGSETSTIDIELDSPVDEHMRAAEEIANSVVFDDRPMRIHLVDEEAAARLPLRKESAVRGTIRVIEVEDFDWSPCGGTHASRTGEVGLIAIKSYERAKRMTRVEFVCGHRALEEYRIANRTAIDVASQFSAGREAGPELVARSLQEIKSLKRRIRDLSELATRAEAADLLQQTLPSNGFKLIKAVFSDRDPDELRLLAAKIVAAEPAVALLASKSTDSARMVFARSASLNQNMGQLMGAASQIVGGRGGGKPELAQGGGPDSTRLEEAVRSAAEALTGSAEGKC